MQKRHKDRSQYFREQSITTEKYIIPFIDDIVKISSDTKVLEVGCGEGGGLLPFLIRGCHCTGLDLSSGKINNAKLFLKDYETDPNLILINRDIYECQPTSDNVYDLIIIKDTIEHIEDQLKFLNHIKGFLKPNGCIFISFPPWQNPFGGHQQMCKSKILSLLPFLHLLPNFLYKFILRIFGENKNTISSLLDVKATRLTLEHYFSIVSKANLKIKNKQLYFINPNYETKFGLKPRRVYKFISKLPHIRNFFITTGYYALTQW